MTYSLNPNLQPLSALEANHLLKRATMGPTQGEINAFTGLDAQQAIQTLFDNINYNPSPPIDLKYDSATPGQEYVNVAYDSSRNNDFQTYYKLWWINMMAALDTSPSIIDKLTLFWQNHFVTTAEAVDEYRAVYKYFTLIRANVLGNFKDFTRSISTDPAMLKYLNGHDNVKATPNENYARELMELFVVGAKDFLGYNNYTENDVKAAARVLTGWRYQNFYGAGTTSVNSYFTLSRHDINTKQFSTSYPDPLNATLGTVISTPLSIPVGYNNVGEYELDELLNMLFLHPETSKFLCRKIYRFFVNPNVTQDIETNVIIPLSNIFKVPDPITGKAFEIKPIIKILLSSEHFYDVANFGAIVKSPLETIIGTLRFNNFQVPAIDLNNLPNSLRNRKAYADYINGGYYPNYSGLTTMQMPLLDQPTVFGYDAYFQTGYSKNWINTTQIGLRNSLTDGLLTGRTLVSGITPLVAIKLDMITVVDLPTTASPYYDASDCVSIVDLAIKNLFALTLSSNQVLFLTDTIMMQNIPRSSWTIEWNNYKSTIPTSPNYTSRRNAVKNRLDNLMKYLFRMAEYHIC